MAYQDPRQPVDAYPPRQEQQAPYRNQKVMVQIPRAPINDFPHGNRAVYSSGPNHTTPNGPVRVLPNAVYSRDPNIRQERQLNPAALLPISTLGTVNGQTSKSAKIFSVSVPAPAPTLGSAALPPVDYQLLLLSLAEDYFAKAHREGSLVALYQRNDELNQYFKLIATGLGCLETVLKNLRLQPNMEATVRLRYASVLFEETENYMEAEEALSKGILLCDRHRFFDLKYNMQHLLARVMNATSSKASVKFLDGVLRDVESYGHIPWVYAFRFLRVSLSLQMSSIQENIVAINHLRFIVNLSNSRGDIAISAIGSIMEALAYIHRSNSTENVEQAQRALAAARSTQLDPAAQTVPQLAAMSYYVDLCCSLQQYDPSQAISKMTAMQTSLDQTISNGQWTDDGLCHIPIGRESSDTLLNSDSVFGVVQVVDQKCTMAIRWLPKEDIYELGYLLSAAAMMHRNATDGQKAELYLKEASRTLKVTNRLREGSLDSLSSRYQWRRTLLCQAYLQLTFTLCARASWSAAKDQLSLLRETSSSLFPIPESLALFINYLTGLIAQGTGDLHTALSIFQSPLLTLPSLNLQTSTSQTHRNISILAALNTVLIIRTPTHPDHTLLTPLLETLESYCLNNPSKPLHAAYHLARATAHPTDSHGIVKTKQGLQSALQIARTCANNQLVCITLNFMSWKFFRGSVTDQAEKSARVSQSLALKVKDPLWICVANGALADTLGVMGKREESEAARREGREWAGKLPVEMQVEEDDEVKGEDEEDGRS